jgi:ribonuclease HIII
MNNELLQKNLEAFRTFVQKEGLTIQKDAPVSGAWHVTVANEKDKHNVIFSQKGNITVQGKKSTLRTTLDSFKPQILSQLTSPSATPPPPVPERAPEQSRALSLSPKDYPQVDQNVLMWVDEQVGSCVHAMLPEADRAIYFSGVKLLLQVKERRLALTDYASIVMPFARAYEGFLIQVAICLHQDSDEQSAFSTAEEAIRLVKKKCLPDDTYQHAGLIDTLQSAWHDIHCSVMFASSPALSRYPRLPLAEQAIGVINRAMYRTYETLIEEGWIERESLSYERSERARIGIDESGKSDCFGPLVVSAVYVDELVEQRLVDLGVRDSKKVKNEQRVLAMAKIIQECCPHAVICIEPSQYHDLHHQLGSENKLLAQAHAQALEQVLEQSPCLYAIADQFGKVSLLQEALLPLGRQVHLEQRPRAEEDLAVAAASIIARATFLQWLKQHSDRIGKELPKGNIATSTNEVAHAILVDSGEQVLAEVVKLPEKITRTTEDLVDS